MQRAAVFLRGGTVFTHAESQTTVGVWIAAPPFQALPEGSDVAEVTRAIHGALEGSRPGVPHPEFSRSASSAAPLYALAGVKAWSAFVHGASQVSVAQDGRGLTISPWLNRGAREGFVPDPGHDVVLPADSPELGAVVLHLLRRSPVDR